MRQSTEAKKIKFAKIFEALAEKLDDGWQKWNQVNAKIRSKVAKLAKTDSKAKAKNCKPNKKKNPNFKLDFWTCCATSNFFARASKLTQIERATKQVVTFLVVELFQENVQRAFQMSHVLSKKSSFSKSS